MTRWTETSGLAAEAQELLFPTVRTPDASETTHRVAAVQIPLHHLLDNRTKIAILSLKTVLILQEKSIKVMKKHSIENTTFRMTLVINPCHGSRDDSRNGPGWRLADIHPL